MRHNVVLSNYRVDRTFELLQFAYEKGMNWKRNAEQKQ